MKTLALYLNLYLYLHLFLHLYLYLPKNGVGANNYRRFKELAWQSFY